MQKIDGHLHLVRSIAGFNGNGRLNPLGAGRAVWDTGEAFQLIPIGYGDEAFLAADAQRLMATGQVDKAVLLQGSLNGYQNAYTADVVAQYPDQFVGAFAIDPFTQQVHQIVRHHVEDLHFRIMKLEMSFGGGLHGYHDPFNLAKNPVLSEVFAYLNTFTGMTVVVDYGRGDEVSHQPTAIVALAQKYPQIDFVVAHLSFAQLDDLDNFDQTLQMFKPFENICLDLSAIQDINDETAMPFMKSEKLVRRAIDMIGADHLIWGSDAPLSATKNAYADLANWLEASGVFTEAELQAMYYGTAERVYFKTKRAFT